MPNMKEKVTQTKLHGRSLIFFLPIRAQGGYMPMWKMTTFGRKTCARGWACAKGFLGGVHFIWWQLPDGHLNAMHMLYYAGKRNGIPTDSGAESAYVFTHMQNWHKPEILRMRMRGCPGTAVVWPTPHPHARPATQCFYRYAARCRLLC